jgi:hypothetical protein
MKGSIRLCISFFDTYGRSNLLGALALTIRALEDGNGGPRYKYW